MQKAKQTGTKLYTMYDITSKLSVFSQTYLVNHAIMFVWMPYMTMTNKTALEVIGCYLGSGVRNGHTEEGYYR